MQCWRRIKGDPKLRDIPVIMISALDEMPGIVRCIEHGAEDFLHKPFDPVLLRARINASLEKKRLRDQEVDYLREVGLVIEAATAVETGNYRAGGLASVARRADELGRLARVFDSMVSQMKAREERLRDQVRDLRSEIEQARRDSKEFPLSVDGGNLRLGERIATRYEVLAELGRGGMGTVYRARDLELDEEIAIKTLRPEFVTDRTLLERFKDEIRLARRLSHQNIVRTHDFGEWSGVYFLTMEYVEGITVRELLDTRGRLGISSTLAIATQLAQSLAVAHEHGVIHRDIKPQNMLLDAAGVLKVMDFGIARLAERSTSVTEAGLVVGTPAYMPPEQLMAEKVDARSDLYAARGRDLRVSHRSPAVRGDDRDLPRRQTAFPGAAPARVGQPGGAAGPVGLGAAAAREATRRPGANGDRVDRAAGRPRLGNLRRNAVNKST